MPEDKIEGLHCALASKPLLTSLFPPSCFILDPNSNRQSQLTHRPLLQGSRQATCRPCPLLLFLWIKLSAVALWWPLFSVSPHSKESEWADPGWKLSSPPSCDPLQTPGISSFPAVSSQYPDTFYLEPTVTTTIKCKEKLLPGSTQPSHSKNSKRKHEPRHKTPTQHRQIQKCSPRPIVLQNPDA